MVKKTVFIILIRTHFMLSGVHSLGSKVTWGWSEEGCHFPSDIFASWSIVFFCVYSLSLFVVNVVLIIQCASTSASQPVKLRMVASVCSVVLSLISESLCCHLRYGWFITPAILRCPLGWEDGLLNFRYFTTTGVSISDFNVFSVFVWI